MSDLKRLSGAGQYVVISFSPFSRKAYAMLCPGDAMGYGAFGKAVVKVHTLGTFAGILPMSNPLTPVDQRIMDALEIALKEVNEKDEGYLPLLEFLLSLQVGPVVSKQLLIAHAKKLDQAKNPERKQE